MLDKLEGIYKRFLELEDLIARPDIIAKQDEWQKLVKEHSSISKIAEKYLEYKKVSLDFAECKEILDHETDRELIDMAKEELPRLNAALEELTQELKVLLLPKDPNDDKNVILEIRAGAGGEEAGLFAAELLRMYLYYAEKKRWKTEEISSNVSDLGGVKEVVYMISGFGAYSRLKYESGVHRVQRVPETESSGRIHTSTVTVAVLPEAEDVQIELQEKDIKVDTYRSSGAGGQHINKTDSAIRMTHIPTGIVVECQDERSQIKNREKALRVLKSRIYDYYQQQAVSEYAAERKSQVGTGDRSERIRTYNFPQGRVSDHRIGLTLYTLNEFLQGELDDMIDALAIEAQRKLLSGEED